MFDRCATTLVLVFHCTDILISRFIVACDSVEVVDMSEHQDQHGITVRGLRELCHKWPKLARIVVSDDLFEEFTNLTVELPKLAVTTDRSESSYDLLHMPI